MQQPLIESNNFFVVSPLVIYPNKLGNFEIYLKSDNHYILYARADRFTEQHKLRLHQSGVKEVYVLVEQEKDYCHYIRNNLGTILQDEAIPNIIRSQALYQTSIDIVKQTFDTQLPEGLPTKLLNNITKLVNDAINFLSIDETLKNLGELMNHSQAIFNHSINTFVLSLSLLQTMDYPKNELTKLGVGIILHDIGKIMVPKRTINKVILNYEDKAILRLHPLYGVALCNRAKIEQETNNIILFHHEKLDGSGYPVGISSTLIPPYVKTIALVDKYDYLTQKMKPFEALSYIRSHLTRYDEDSYEAFVRLLSGRII